MKNYRTQFSYRKDYDPERSGEINNEESMTVPGDGIKIPELMEKILAGSEFDPMEGIYLDQEDMDMVRRFYKPHLDLTDLEGLAQLNQSMTEAVQEAIERRDAAEAAEAEEAAAEASEASEGAENAPEGEGE